MARIHIGDQFRLPRARKVRASDADTEFLKGKKTDLEKYTLYTVTRVFEDAVWVESNPCGGLFKSVGVARSALRRILDKYKVNE